jgi:hypothetical protein
MSAFHSVSPYLYGMMDRPSPVPSIEEHRVPRANLTVQHRPSRAQRRLDQALESGWLTLGVRSRFDTEETLHGVASEILAAARTVMARHGRPAALAQMRDAEHPDDLSDRAEIWRLVLRAVRSSL